MQIKQFKEKQILVKFFGLFLLILLVPHQAGSLYIKSRCKFYVLIFFQTQYDIICTKTYKMYNNINNDVSVVEELIT